MKKTIKMLTILCVVFGTTFLISCQKENLDSSLFEKSSNEQLNQKGSVEMTMSISIIAESFGITGLFINEETFNYVFGENEYVAQLEEDHTRIINGEDIYKIYDSMNEIVTILNGTVISSLSWNQFTDEFEGGENIESLVVLTNIINDYDLFDVTSIYPPQNMPDPEELLVCFDTIGSSSCDEWANDMFNDQCGGFTGQGEGSVEDNSYCWRGFCVHTYEIDCA